ncbi:NUDIX domain-containing protein [Gorillibacterium sp. sgz500922]|uniref:NUDIX domain-containing protein n=1 Tax=Gorillibacterium sp. sgz500922 TaxID=3446694 RepID=UPI003F66B203
MTTNQELVFGEKAAGVSYRDRPGVYAVIETEGKVAVITTRERVFLPGGGLEGEETHYDCLRRECAEELGCHIEVRDYIGKASQYAISFKNKEPLRLIGHFYAAKITGTNALKIEEDHELVWISADEAVDRMYVEFQAWAIQEYLHLTKFRASIHTL